MLAARDLPGDGDLDDRVIDDLLADAGTAAVHAVGHRIVHGGPDFTGPTRLDQDVRDRLAGLVDLAPLHIPPALAGIDAVAPAPAGCAGRRLLRHRVPRRNAQRSLRLPGACRVAEALGSPPLRLPRLVLCLRVAAGRPAS